MEWGVGGVDVQGVVFWLLYSGGTPRGIHLLIRARDDHKMALAGVLRQASHMTPRDRTSASLRPSEIERRFPP